MAWTTLILTFSLVLLAFNLLKSWLTTHKKLPPGPKGLPILGHLHLLSKNPHQDFQKLSQKHGPIMYMRFGFVPNIVVSSPQAAEQFLKINDINFAGRPSLEAAKYMSYEQKNLTFASYGPYWRDMRKLCTTELLSNLKINTFQAMRKQEVKLMLESLENAAQNGVVVDLTAKASATTSDMSCRMVFGKKYEDKGMDERGGLKEVMQQGIQIAATFNLGDYFPYLGVLDLQGLTRQMKGIAKLWDEFFERIIDEHENKSKEERDGEVSKDFVDTMLQIMKSGGREFEFDRSHVKAVLLDLITAATDTTVTIIDWILSELLKHPHVMKKVQHELEQVVSLDRMVEESDLANLGYLDMVIKESFRLHPVVPLLLHESIQDCTVNGFFIPKKSRIVINIYAIGRDPKVWTDAEKFYPERFVGSNIDLQGRDFELLPFGAGRRGCPGTQLGITVVRLMVAQLVHCFDWELPNGMKPEEVDMNEEFGLVINRAKHLMAIPSCRLHKN